METTEIATFKTARKLKKNDSQTGINTANEKRNNKIFYKTLISFGDPNT